MRWTLCWLVCLVLGAGAVARSQSAPRWRMTFFHDQDESSLTINDLQFPSRTRGIAAGFVVTKKSARPTVLVTNDGGARWTLVPVREAGLSLFFLDDSRGWMVTEKGIWKTEESGRSWRKISRQADLLRVHFANPTRGWAVGRRRAFLETSDGGLTWTRVAIASPIKTTEEFTTLSWINFATPTMGTVTGWSRPPRQNDSRFPDWMMPQQARLRGEFPTLSVLVETRDGGKTWQPQVTSMFGEITRVRMQTTGLGLALIEFVDWFRFPSEVYRLDLRTGGSERCFRFKDRSVTDIALPLGGPALLASVDVLGELRHSPIPSKVRVYRSYDLLHWSEMNVDYRAVATRATLAAADPEHVWLATDTGMILQLATH